VARRGDAGGEVALGHPLYSPVDQAHVGEDGPRRVEDARDGEGRDEGAQYRVDDYGSPLRALGALLEDPDEALEIALEDIAEEEGGRAYVVEDPVEGFVLRELEAAVELLVAGVALAQEAEVGLQSLELLERPVAQGPGHFVGRLSLLVGHELPQDGIGHEVCVGIPELIDGLGPFPLRPAAGRREHDALEGGIEPRPEEVEDEVRHEPVRPAGLRDKLHSSLYRAAHRGDFLVGPHRKGRIDQEADGDEEDEGEELVANSHGLGL
jgi:hypothetical protein